MHHYKNLPENEKCMKICQKQVFLCQKIQLFFIMKHTTVSFNNIFFQRMIVSLVPLKKCPKDQK